MFHSVMLMCAMAFGGCFIAVPKENPFRTLEKCEQFTTERMLRLKMHPTFKEPLLKEPNHLFVGQCVNRPADWDGNKQTDEILESFKDQLQKHLRGSNVKP
jgi:hypothetical protein